MFVRRSLIAVLTCLALAACGGSSHRSVSSTTATGGSGGSSGTTAATASTLATRNAGSASTTRTATHPTTTRTATHPATTRTAAHPATTRTGPHPATRAATIVTTTTSRPPEVPRSRAHKTSSPVHSSGGGQGRQEIATALVIATGGRLTPAGQAFPSGATIRLKLSNRDHAAHVVVVTFPRRQTVHLSPGADASVLQRDPPNGSYQILVDGRREGRLIVGAEGGP